MQTSKQEHLIIMSASNTSTTSSNSENRNDLGNVEVGSTAEQVQETLNAPENNSMLIFYIVIYIHDNVVTITKPVLPNTPNTFGEMAYGFLPYPLDEEDKLCKDGFGM